MRQTFAIAMMGTSLTLPCGLDCKMMSY